MRRWARFAMAFGGGIVGGAASAASVGSLLWDRSTAGVVRQLIQGRIRSHVPDFSLEQLDGLPPPVARYFAFALTPGTPLIRGAHIEQTGEFRTGGLEAPWSPFTAVHHVSTDPPGFVWDSTIRMARFLPVRVRDSYVRGKGSMQSKLAALFTVVDQRDRPELDAGALQRYLAEAVWFPTALLPSQGIVWEGIDRSTARATLTDGDVTASLEFQFAENGAIVRAFTPGRFREVEGNYVLTPWACYYREYSEVHAIRVPMAGEVEWHLPEGRLPYWRGRLMGHRFEFQT